MRKKQEIRKGDRVRATQDIRLEGYAFCDIKAGDEGTVVKKDTPEKARNCWRITILFDSAILPDGSRYLVQLAYPTDKVEKPPLLLPGVHGPPWPPS